MKWENIRPRDKASAAVASAAAAFAIGMLTAPEWYWITVGGLLTLVAVGVPIFEQFRAMAATRTATSVATEAAARRLTELTDGLDPICDLLLAIARQPLAARRGQATALILGALPQMLARGTNRVRACYFTVRPGPPRTLHRELTTGRSGAQTSSFTEGEVVGDAVLKMLDSGGSYYCADVDAAPPPGWSSAAHAYKTFISVTVAPKGGPLGMLTVDAPSPDDLSDLDVPLVIVMGKLLSIALS